MKLYRTILIFSVIIPLLCGLLLFYRGCQPIESLYKISGTITNLTFQEFRSGKSGLAYSLDFTLAETPKIYGIYIGTRDQTDSIKILSKLKIGEQYNFYIDKTVGTDGHHTLGIRFIEKNGQYVYQENPKANYIGGSLFLIMGIAVLAIIIVIDRRKKLSLTV